ncbi:MAG TPA: hypothetical protein PKA78_12860 [Macellibacteroides fermentans]|nr:hypothetical protein [Macellibacteroides fermentans]
MKVKEFIFKTELLCEHCGKDLLTDPASGIFVCLYESSYQI